MSGCSTVGSAKISETFKEFKENKAVKKLFTDAGSSYLMERKFFHLIL